MVNKYDLFKYGFRSYYISHDWPGHVLGSLLGFRQTSNEQASNRAQISYEEYLKGGNRRAIADYHRNVPRPMRYPELSYPGQVYRSDTAIARNLFDYDTAGANLYGRSLYGTAGLYGVGSRASRFL